MNKYLYILGLAGAALFSACSTSDDLSIGETPAIDKAKESVLIYEASQDSEEPITLGIGQSRGYTRTPLDTDVDEGFGNFKTESNRFIGVFCLATGTQTGADVPDAVASNHWSDDATTTGKEEHYFYPMSNWMKYNFYAYYPQFNSSTIKIGEDENQKSKVEVTGYEIDGSQDLIWGMAHPENPTHDSEDATYADPYSAKYLLWRKNHLEDKTIDYWYPKFTFEHKLVKFRIFVKAVDNAALTSIKNAQAKITDMYIDNAIYKLKFCVASQADGFNDCQLAMDGNLATVTKKLGIKKMSSNDDIFNGSTYFTFKSYNNDVSNDDYTIGYIGYIMLPSPELSNDSGFNYQLKMTVNYKDGSVFKDKEITRKILSPTTDGFVAGKTYNIIIRLDSSDLGI